MKLKPILLTTFALVLVGAAIGGGTLLGRSLSASPLESPRLANLMQTAEGTFPLSFQGILLDEDGNPVANSSHSLTFSIYDDEDATVAMWRETLTVFTVDGLFTAQLGVEEDIDPNIFSSNPETFLGVRVGFTPELEPKLRLAYAPYAFHSITADTVISPPANPRRIAQGRWYEANLTGVRVRVDDSPSDIAFDGESLWVITRGESDTANDDNATKIRPTTAAKQVEVSVGKTPTDILFDGRHIWVANSDDNSLTRFRPDGSSSTLLPLGTNGSFDNSILKKPVALAFDGNSIWVANQANGSVIKIRATEVDNEEEIEEIIDDLQEQLDDDDDLSAGDPDKLSSSERTAIEDEIDFLGGFLESVQDEISVGSNPSAMAFDGENIWVLHGGSRNVTRIRASDGTKIDNRRAGSGRADILFDGESMWIANEGDNSVTKIRISDFEEIDTYAVGGRPTALAFDGEAIWVANKDSNNVTKLRASDGKRLGTFPVDKSPVAIGFDGVHVWVVSEEEDSIVMR